MFELLTLALTQVRVTLPCVVPVVRPTRVSVSPVATDAAAERALEDPLHS